MRGIALLLEGSQLRLPESAVVVDVVADPVALWAVDWSLARGVVAPLEAPEVTSPATVTLSTAVAAAMVIHTDRPVPPLRCISVGRIHTGTHVIMPVHQLHVRVVQAATGELLRDFTLDPTRDYQPTGAPKGPARPRKS